MGRPNIRSRDGGERRGLARRLTEHGSVAKPSRVEISQTREKYNLTRLLSNETGDIFAQILSSLNRTEYVNLLLTCRRVKDNFEIRTPSIHQKCGALRAPQSDISGQILEISPRKTCALDVQQTDTGLRACEGPILFNTQSHGPTLEVCGFCSNEALDMIKPRKHFVATPLCKPCSVAETSVHPLHSYICRCLSPFSSPLMKARLCYDCRAEVQRQREDQKIKLMRRKLPVLNAAFADTQSDERRWRQRSLVLLGYNKVGCRGCGKNWEQLQESYVLGDGEPAPSTQDEDATDYTDESIQNSKMGMMVFVCLECDRHVSHYNATVNTYGTWGAV